MNSEDNLGSHADAYLNRTIAEGVTGTGMVALSEPRGGTLTEEKIDHLVAFIRGCEAGRQAQPTPLPEATPALEATPTAEMLSAGEDAVRGAVLFAATCAPCHGSEGAGGAGAREPMNSAEFFDSRCDDDLRKAISDGEGTAMPGFGGTLTAQEIADMVAFFRS